jgi:2-keto-4-pentenoate hydratase/2-oxohepta-3-ene-1,7-dioic acid hydratase in catechol pathway
VKVARFSAGAGPRVGLVDGDAIVQLAAASVLDVVLGDPAAIREEGTTHLIDDVRLLCPAAPLQRNVFCVGWNYLKHFEEGQSRRDAAITEPPARPTFFTKATGAVVGPRDPVEAHASLTSMLDWEVELAVLIGRPGRDIAEADAMTHVAGFMVALDITARDISRAHGGQWFRGKSLDHTSPIGPWLVTPEELGELSERSMTCRVNGEVVQSAVLGEMYFGVGRVIAELSAGLSLQRGDLILTGTPEGTGIGRDPAQFLAVGDVVEASIEGVGELCTEVVAAYPTVVDSSDIFDYVYGSSAAGGSSA